MSLFHEIDPAEYTRARAQSWAGSSLNEEPPARFFQLGDEPVYYGLTQSPEGLELVGVMNNSRTPDMLPLIVADALKRGAEVLNAWNVRSPRFPRGLLQTLYEREGFVRTHSVPYDADSYGPPSPELQQVWRLMGWDGMLLPEVVYMRHINSMRLRRVA